MNPLRAYIRRVVRQQLEAESQMREDLKAASRRIEAWSGPTPQVTPADLERRIADLSATLAKLLIDNNAVLTRQLQQRGVIQPDSLGLSAETLRLLLGGEG